MFKKILTISLITLVLAINFYLGFTRLGQYSAVDEPYWTYGRTSKFWNSVEAHKWKSTSVNDKPGITVAILSGAGLFKFDPMQYKSLRGDQKTPQQLQDINDINFYFRLPIFLFCFLMLYGFYFLTKKLLDEKVALLSFIFIGLSPILLGISLIINPDSLLWIFLPFSLLSYLVFQKNAQRKYLYASGIFLGFSLLTKYVSNILYIFFFILPFLEYIFAKEKPELKKYLLKSAKDYAAVILISMAVYFVFYPATWVNSKVLLEGTFLSKAFKSTWPLFVGVIVMVAADIFLFKNKFILPILNFLSRQKKTLLQLTSALMLIAVAFVLLDTYIGMKPFDFESIIASPKGSGVGLTLFIQKILADLYSLIFGISPIAFLAFIAAFALSFKKNWIERFESKIIFYFGIFILFYYFASTVNNVVATVRYQIILYPLAFIIAAIGVSNLFEIKRFQNIKAKTFIYLFVFAACVFSILSIKPFYFAYTSEILPAKYFVNLKDMGDGSWEAANYLNNLPNAENLTIWSDKGAVCAVFSGKCIIGFNPKEYKGLNFDYLVTSSGRKSRTLKLSRPVSSIFDFKKAYETENTALKVTIGNRETNFVKVISATEVQK